MRHSWSKVRVDDWAPPQPVCSQGPKSDLFSSVLAYEPFLKDLFPGTLGVKDFEDHARHRRILQSAFHKKCLVGYVELLNELSIEQMKELPVDRSFKSFVRVKDLLLWTRLVFF